MKITILISIFLGLCSWIQSFAFLKARRKEEKSELTVTFFSRDRSVDRHFIAENLTDHKQISIVSMGLEVLCGFVTSNKFHMRFWMITGSDLFGDAVMLPCIISFLLKKALYLGNSNYGAILKI